MKIAVTGASGFIGQELLAELTKRGDVEITALTRGSREINASSVCTWIKTDYSVSSLADALNGSDVVIHLAGVRGTGSNPEDYAVNAEMTEKLLKSMMIAKVKRIVFASTVSVYNDEKHMPWAEEAPLKGRTAYGESKIICEKLIERYAAEYDFTYATARIAQVMGEGEKRRGMMNVFLDAAKEHGTLKVMGKSIIKRQYIYIKDLVNILSIMAVDKSSCDKNLQLNVGMPNAYSNLEIANMVNEVYNNPTPIQYDDSYPEAGRGFCMDISRLIQELNYYPLDMREALEDYRKATM